ncbi:hypothetical protein ACWDSJ_10840 [Nocardia sp. NPDC003482]
MTDTTDDKTDEPTTEETETPAAQRHSWVGKARAAVSGRRGVVAVRAAAAILVGASVGAAGYFYVQDAHHRDLLDAHEAARTAACDYAPVLANYDAKNLDAYFSAVLAGATGDWKKQFDSTSKDLRDVLGQGQVVSHATDVQCALESGDERSAEAIVVIGQSVTSTGTQGKPAPGQLSMVMWLEKSGDRWLVNKLNSPLAKPNP